eukprot:1186892-Prorocentrum_minimum.AAC.1
MAAACGTVVTVVTVVSRLIRGDLQLADHSVRTQRAAWQVPAGAAEDAGRGEMRAQHRHLQRAAHLVQPGLASQPAPGGVCRRRRGEQREGVQRGVRRGVRRGVTGGPQGVHGGSTGGLPSAQRRTPTPSR